jgi:hypothetical protein
VDFNLPSNWWVSQLQKSEFAVLVLGFEKLGLGLDNCVRTTKNAYCRIYSRWEIDIRILYLRWIPELHFFFQRARVDARKMRQWTCPRFISVVCGSFPDESTIILEHWISTLEKKNAWLHWVHFWILETTYLSVHLWLSSSWAMVLSADFVTLILTSVSCVSCMDHFWMDLNARSCFFDYSEILQWRNFTAAWIWGLKLSHVLRL